jgi:hypothetical protein
LIVLFGKLYKLYGHALEIIGRRQTSMAGPKYIHITIIILKSVFKIPHPPSPIICQ